jgi:hypothetical protein
MCNTTHPRKAHYFAYQLNSKAKSTLATYQCLALVSSNQIKKTTSENHNINAFPQEIIMPSTAKQAKTTALESIRANPFTRVHGRPTRRNYKTLKKESSVLVSEIKDITYSWSKNETITVGYLPSSLALKSTTN